MQGQAPNLLGEPKVAVPRLPPIVIIDQLKRYGVSGAQKLLLAWLLFQEGGTGSLLENLMLHLVDPTLRDDDDAFWFLALQEKDLPPMVGFRLDQGCHLLYHKFRDRLEGSQPV